MAFDPKPGLELGGRYRLVASLGGGVLDDRWRAVDVDRGRKVTVRFLRGEGLGAPAVAHVWRAAMLVERLGHEGAMPILDVQQAGSPDVSPPIVVAPYVEGYDFATWLRAQPRSLRSAIAVLREAVDVLEAAHAAVDSRGRPAPLEHLGLKPSEILVGRDVYRNPHSGRKMRVRVLDFGLVRDRTDEDHTGTMTAVFSPRFESPERFASPELVGPWSDVWSIGVMLYVIASGRYPYGEASDTPFMLQRRIVERDCPTLDEVAPEVPIELSAIVDRCLSRNPSMRFENAAELGRALDAMPEVPKILAAHTFPPFGQGDIRVSQEIVARAAISVPPPPPGAPSSDARGRVLPSLALATTLAIASLLVGDTGRHGAHAEVIPMRAAEGTQPGAAMPSASPTARASSAHRRRDPSGAVSPLAAELLADNPFLAFAVPETPQPLGCSDAPPLARVEIEWVMPKAPLRLSMIARGVLNGLPRTGTCDQEERRDDRGRCWVMGCPENTSPDGNGHCVARRVARAPLQGCFRSDASLSSVAASAGAELQEHEVTWAELGRFLEATHRRAFITVDVASSAVHANVWDGAFPAAVAMLPAHGIPRPLAAAYCQAIGGRLPHEAEIETAARGAAFVPAPWGDGLVAYGNEVPSLGANGTRPRAVRDPSSPDRTAGEEPIYDLVSNVREWAIESYRPDTRAHGAIAAAGTPYRVSASSIPYGVVRGLPLVVPDGWPRLSQPTDAKALLPVPAAYRMPVCASTNANIVASGVCGTESQGYLGALRDVGFRCARSEPAR